MSVRLTDLSQTQKISEHRRQELAGETNVLVLRDRGGVRQEMESDGQLVLANTPPKERTAAIAARTPGMFDWVFSGLSKVTQAGVRTAAVSFDTIAGLFGRETPPAELKQKSKTADVVSKTDKAIQATTSILERSANAVSGALESSWNSIRNLINEAQIK